jgi:2-C-methyl-D-erythritol 4-phosphate cytidylyltransferase/2-C-methyl-D-erythritol 2,4-cyclodiphosphate synthase
LTEPLRPPSIHVTAIIAAGGAGRRLGAHVPKQLLVVGGVPMLQRSVEAFLTHPLVNEVVVALPASLTASPPAWLKGVRVVAGGDSRQESVARAFDVVPVKSDVVLVHDAARPFVTREIISRAIDAAARYGAAIPAVPASDTVKRVDAGDGPAVVAETIPREQVFLAQTPQAFRRSILGRAVALGRTGVPGTDEASLVERSGHAVRVVAGDVSNVKITTPADLERASGRLSPGSRSPGLARIGVGYDLHRLVDGRPLILGGVTVPFERGAHGHSDADVICHAVTDAILGAARAGDIGQLYPDTDPRWKGAASVELLRSAATLVRSQGWALENIDVVVVLERPKLSSYRTAMEANLANAVGLPSAAVSIKAKTNEGMDAVGRGDAVAAHAVALLRGSGPNGD